jgi:hypothetical protein
MARAYGYSSAKSSAGQGSDQARSGMEMSVGVGKRLGVAQIGELGDLDHGWIENFIAASNQ